MRIFCQYSYGGFRTYRISGEEYEALDDKEVTSENNADFPELADLYFNRGDCKLIYRKLNENEIALVVRDIPGPQKDSEGRALNTAIQFIAVNDEKRTLDNLCLSIIKDIDTFGNIFASGFSLRGGLHYKGIKLMDFIKEAGNSYYSALPNTLADFYSRNDNVLLFVSPNKYFGTDKDYTAKVIDRLKLVSSKHEVRGLLNNSMCIDELFPLCWPQVVSTNGSKVDDDISTPIKSEISNNTDNIENSVVEENIVQAELDSNTSLSTEVNDIEGKKGVVSQPDILAVMTENKCLTQELNNLKYTISTKDRTIKLIIGFSAILAIWLVVELFNK